MKLHGVLCAIYSKEVLQIDEVDLWIDKEDYTIKSLLNIFGMK